MVVFGPAYLVATATTLIMAQPTYLVLKVAKKVGQVNPSESWEHSMHHCTVLGYVLLTIGMVWVTGAWGKLYKLCGYKRDTSL